MKFVVNGGLVIGTCDGANIELTRECGDNNIFLFGHLSEEVEDLRHAHQYPPSGSAPAFDQDLAAVFDAIRDNVFGDAGQFAALVDGVQYHGDYYLVSDDFASYCQTQDLIDEAFRDKEGWLDRCIVAVSRMGFFSSDRCITEYAEGIWNVEPLDMGGAAGGGDEGGAVGVEGDAAGGEGVNGNGAA